MERIRLLESKSFANGQPLSIAMPRDTVAKHLKLTLSGSVQCSYSGSPAAFPTNTLDVLLQRAEVVINGSRTVVSTRPWMARMFNFLSSGVAPERRHTTGSAAYAVPRGVDVDAGFTFPTSTQYATLTESVIIPFGMPDKLAVNGGMTYLDLRESRGVSTAELKLSCGSLASLEGSSTTVVVTYANINLTFDVELLEADIFAMGDFKFMDLKQSYSSYQLSAAATDYEITLNRGNKLAGIGILCETNLGSTGSVEAVKKLSNLGLTKIKLLVNGSRIVKSTDFLSLQNENRMKLGVNAAFASNVSPFDGYAYMNLLEDFNLLTALDLSAVDSVKLQISTRAASGSAPYITYPLGIGIQTYEVANV